MWKDGDRKAGFATAMNRCFFVGIKGQLRGKSNSLVMRTLYPG